MTATMTTTIINSPYNTHHHSGVTVSKYFTAIATETSIILYIRMDLCMYLPQANTLIMQIDMQHAVHSMAQNRTVNLTGLSSYNVRT